MPSFTYDFMRLRKNIPVSSILPDLPAFFYILRRAGADRNFGSENSFQIWRSF